MLLTRMSHRICARMIVVCGIIRDSLFVLPFLPIDDVYSYRNKQDR